MEVDGVVMGDATIGVSGENELEDTNVLRAVRGTLICVVVSVASPLNWTNTAWSRETASSGLEWSFCLSDLRLNSELDDVDALNAEDERDFDEERGGMGGMRTSMSDKQN